MLGFEQFLKQLTPENHKFIEEGLAELERDWQFNLEELNYA